MAGHVGAACMALLPPRLPCRRCCSVAPVPPECLPPGGCLLCRHSWLMLLPHALCSSAHSFSLLPVLQLLIEKYGLSEEQLAPKLARLAKQVGATQ